MAEWGNSSIFGALFVRKMVLKIIICLIAFIVFLKLFVYYYERKLIYFPFSIIESTPDAMNMKYEDVYFVTADAVRLNGWFISAPESIATIIYCHGNAGNISHRVDKIKMFYDKHISVFAFDYRGYGRSEGNPNEQGLYYDGEAAYYYLVRKRKMNPAEIVLFGESIGSAVASYIAQHHQIKALILEAPFTNARDMSRRILPFLPVQWFVTIQMDNVKMLDKVQTPVLVIHGTDDDIVPFELGRQLYDSLPSSKKRFLEISGAGHNDVAYIDGNRYFETIRQTILHKTVE